MKKMKKITNESRGSLHNNPDVSDKLYRDSLNIYRVISSDGDVKLVRAKNRFDAELLSGFDDVLEVEKPDEIAEDFETYENESGASSSFGGVNTIKIDDLAEELFVEESRQLNYDDDLIAVTLNNKEVYKGMAEDWINDSFDEDFVWIPAKGYYEAHNDKGVWTVRVIRADDLNPLGETLTETYDEDELSDFKDKIFNIQKIENIYRRKKYGEKQLFARCTCTKCGREKRVFLSNLINDPEKYGSCICSDTYIDSKIDKISKMYSNKKKLSNNTSGYTGVSYVKSYGGEPYNKWRAYIEIDGKRNYLGDFTSKNDAVEARKEAGEKGIKWYRENRSKLIKDVRRRTKKTDKSKYRDTAAKVSVLKKDEK